MADAQRTEKPTGKRIGKALEEGNLPKSTEVPALFVLGAFLAFASTSGREWLGRVEAFLASSLSGIVQPDFTAQSISALSGATASTMLALLASPMLAMVGAGIAGHVVQHPPVFTLKPLEPKLSKLSPARNLGRLASFTPWYEALKGFLKMAAYAWAGWWAVRGFFRDPSQLWSGEEGAFRTIAALAWRVLTATFGVALVLALVDVFWRRYEWYRNLRMTKQEIRDESREHEGDPHVRARIRSRQFAAARQRMMSDVPKATVVVTNPTHFAVALRYVHGETPVPKVLAKGAGLIALKIRETAREHRVPVVENPPLARALFKAVKVGGTVPPAFFQAVAAVLALVLKGRRTAEAGVLR
jgi:flagellar biosynthetic protein FlhB